jgi:hypothetical protein
MTLDDFKEHVFSICRHMTRGDKKHKE